MHRGSSGSDYRWQILVIALLFVTCEVGHAQVRMTEMNPTYTLLAADYEANTYIPPFLGDVQKHSGERSAVFQIQFSDNFPAAAREAFQYAADIWGVYLHSEQPIVVEAEWAELPEGTLGAAGPLLVGNFMGATYSEVWYPVALANAIAGRDFFANQPDIRATFNSAFPSWYFGLDGDGPVGSYDFVTVVLHELGHGLGFSGSFSVDDGDAENGDECEGVPAGWGCWGIPASGGSTLYPMIYDLFVEDADEVSMLVESVYPNPSMKLADGLQSDAVFFDGAFSRPVNNDVPINLYAPTSFDLGSSFSHLDESTFATPPNGPADPDALMTPFLARSEAIHSPGAITCAIFEDFGWEIGEGCLALLDAVTGTEAELEEVVAGAFTLDSFFPNPAVGEATAILRVSEAQQVGIDVFNAAGQRITSQALRRVGANESVSVRLETASWAPGVYFVRIQGEAFAAVESLVQVAH